MFAAKSNDINDMITVELDSFRIMRYLVVEEAESLAPHSLWNLHHLRTLGINSNEATTLLIDYDKLRMVRNNAETVIHHYAPDGFTEIRSPIHTLAKFTLLPRYLTLLYRMHYQTEYPDMPKNWLHQVTSIRLKGELTADKHLVDAAKDIVRYEIWASVENRLAYYSSLRRLKRTKRSHEIFIQKLADLFNSETPIQP